ncbi:hypothetical protein Nocox_00805 [Nonomuraea coxensis DSM 45129]|uniref:Uncharacterized protein n=1 Tax=Nonomuraea coxensis DSM 45129 TaxID=1122611 RepID=A0ABX8TSP1_9ACTN|nr:hypothetical protein [Nonomuraea coxensis]QYC37797.1 hypothetical protein Nocox_00805 [Nonomuraea coxensis DSM 45129]
MVLLSAGPVVQLPRFRLVGDGRPATCSGYVLTPGVTFSLVEGPGRFRLMVEGITHHDEADGRFAWLRQVERAGGAVVAVVDRRGVPHDWAGLAASGRARGGYVPIVRRAGRGARGSRTI